MLYFHIDIHFVYCIVLYCKIIKIDHTDAGQMR